MLTWINNTKDTAYQHFQRTLPSYFYGTQLTHFQRTLPSYFYGTQLTHFQRTLLTHFQRTLLTCFQRTLLTDRALLTFDCRTQVFHYQRTLLARLQRTDFKQDTADPLLKDPVKPALKSAVNRPFPRTLQPASPKDTIARTKKAWIVFPETRAPTW